MACGPPSRWFWPRWRSNCSSAVPPAAPARSDEPCVLPPATIGALAAGASGTRPAAAGFRPPRLVMRAKMTTDSSSPRGSEFSVRVTPEDLQTALSRALALAADGLAAPGAAEAPVEVVPPRRSELGDWSTTAALRAAARPSGRLDLRSEEHTSELQSRGHLVCRLLLDKTNATCAVCEP